MKLKFLVIDKSLLNPAIAGSFVVTLAANTTTITWTADQYASAADLSAAIVTAINDLIATQQINAVESASVIVVALMDQFDFTLVASLNDDSDATILNGVVIRSTDFNASLSLGLSLLPRSNAIEQTSGKYGE